MAIVAYMIVLVLLFLLPMKMKFQIRGTFEKIVDYINIVKINFETFDKLVHQDIVSFRFFHMKFALINDPTLVTRALNSDVCSEKPKVFYQMLDIDHGMIAARCE